MSTTSLPRLGSSARNLQLLMLGKAHLDRDLFAAWCRVRGSLQMLGKAHLVIALLLSLHWPMLGKAHLDRDMFVAWC